MPPHRSFTSQGSLHRSTLHSIDPANLSICFFISLDILTSAVFRRPFHMICPVIDIRFKKLDPAAPIIRVAPPIQDPWYLFSYPVPSSSVVCILFCRAASVVPFIGISLRMARYAVAYDDSDKKRSYDRWLSFLTEDY